MVSYHACCKSFLIQWFWNFSPEKVKQQSTNRNWFHLARMCVLTSRIVCGSKLCESVRMSHVSYLWNNLDVDFDSLTQPSNQRVAKHSTHVIQRRWKPVSRSAAEDWRGRVHFRALQAEEEVLKASPSIPKWNECSKMHDRWMDSCPAHSHLLQLPKRLIIFFKCEFMRP